MNNSLQKPGGILDDTTSEEDNKYAENDSQKDANEFEKKLLLQRQQEEK